MTNTILTWLAIISLYAMLFIYINYNDRIWDLQNKLNKSSGAVDNEIIKVIKDKHPEVR